MSSYFLKLDRFEGPLDLLLHLIKVNEVDIFNIDVLLLTTQYVEYLRLLKFDDLAHAGEFLEMAATLVEIKTRMLLPKTEASENSTEEIEDDPKKSLEMRLLEYERFRHAAETLGQSFESGSEFWLSCEWRRLEPEFDGVERPLIGDPASLVILYEQLLKAVAERKPTAKVEAKTHLVTVEEKIQELEKLLQTANFALFQGFYNSFRSRYEFVVNVLAVLELARWQKAKIYQQDMNGPLWFYRYDLSESELPVLTAGEWTPSAEGNQSL